MIFGIGTDVCDLRRIAGSLERHGDRFAERVLGSSELEVFLQRRSKVAARGVSYLGSRFSAKESFSKAIGIGMHSPMTWHDCEILNAPDGQPHIQLHGELAAWFAARRLRAHVTLSDESDYAVSFVVVETNP
jgi:holo-[acyl-carrier protein] synthase